MASSDRTGFINQFNLPSANADSRTTTVYKRNELYCNVFNQFNVRNGETGHEKCPSYDVDCNVFNEYNFNVRNADVDIEITESRSTFTVKSRNSAQTNITVRIITEEQVNNTATVNHRDSNRLNKSDKKRKLKKCSLFNCWAFLCK